MRWLASVSLSILLGACVQTPPRPLPEIETRPPDKLVLPEWEYIGVSVQGRPIRHRAIGTGHRRVLFIGGIHGNEVEGMVATAQLPAAFLRSPGLASQITLHIVEDMNPDGRHARSRHNRRGIDLNRDFPASNRKQGRGLSQPESRAIHDLILLLQPDLVIVAHSWSKDYFINYDGPARHLASMFSKHSGFRVKPSSSIAATPGSLGSWCGWDLRIPILTVEWRRGTSPLKAWNDTRTALLSVIRGTPSH